MSSASSTASRTPRRSLLDRWFKDVKLPTRAATELAELQSRGSVVFVLRSASILSFLFLAWASRRLDLAPVRAALGLRGLLPWLFRIRAAPRALEDALSRGHSALVFLTRAEGPDPFPRLCDLQRRLGRPIFLVPALLVWSRRPQKLRRLTLGALLFGNPETPNRLANAISFLGNRKRALLRLGAATEIGAVQRQDPAESDAVTGRKLRSALHLHLARNFRAAVGPPLKTAVRVREQVLRDKGLRTALARVAAERGVALESVQDEARADLDELASRYSQGFIEVVRPFFAWFFRRKYESIEVDEAGLEEVKRAATEAPLVVCPSHKSYIDFLFVSWLFYENGLTPPHIAAGINLAFWPFGRLLRMGGAFFIRRTVKGDRVYTAVLRAYVKQLLRDRFPQEFFLEGGRSRTGKLLFPKTGLFSMEVDAWLDGATEDVRFVPVAVDYEQLLEAGSYARELAGGEKQKENLAGLWKARNVLGARKLGRIYVQFGPPVSLKELARQRLGERAAGLALDEEMAPLEGALAPAATLAGAPAAKRELVQHLANTMAFGIAEAITVTPTGLLAAALLSHARRGLSADEVARRVELLRGLAVADGARLGTGLADSPADPRRPGAVADALAKLAAEGLVKVEEAAGEVICQVPEEKRPELDFHRNAVLHRFVGLSLVAAALRASAPWSVEAQVKERARFLSRLLKLEFMFKVGVSFDDAFAAQLATLVRLGAATAEERGLSPGPDRATLDLFADLTRAFLEAYRISADAVATAFPGGEILDRRALVRVALERGRAAYLAGRVAHREALSKATLENALEWLVQQGALLEADGKLSLSPEWRAGRVSRHLADLDLLLR